MDPSDPNAANRLLPLVYDELRKLAAVRISSEKPGQTLQATALVHEAYARLASGTGGEPWNSRGHFFGAAAEAMRRILIDRARQKKRLKSGGDCKRIDLESIELAMETPDEELLAFDEVLDRFSQDYPDCANLVKLRFFAGLSQSEAADSLGMPRRSADRHWAFARAWLRKRLENS